MRALTCLCLMTGLLCTLPMLAQAEDEQPTTVYSVQFVVAEGPSELFAGDRQPAELLKHIEQLQTDGKLSRHLQLTGNSLAHEEGMLQFGQTVAVPESRTMGFGGRNPSDPANPARPSVQTNYSRQNVGTILRFTALPRNDKILTELQFEQTALRPATPAADGSFTPTPSDTTHVKTALALKDGETAVVGGLQSQTGKENATQQVMLVTVRVVK